MKCESIRKKLLLAQSGELSRFGRLGLARHLRGCAHCRRFDQELNRVTAALRTPRVVPDVGPVVLERLRVAARKQTSRRELIRIRPGREPLSVTLRPMTIYSALCILLLTGFWLAIRPALHQPQVARTEPIPAVSGDWDTANIDIQIEDLSDRLDVAAADEDLLSAETEDIDSIARKLLKLEG
jgi:hypothetical protein